MISSTLPAEKSLKQQNNNNNYRASPANTNTDANPTAGSFSASCSSSQAKSVMRCNPGTTAVQSSINWCYARLICNAESNSTKTGKHGSRQLVPLNTQTPGREDIKTTLHMLWSMWKLSFGACLMFISLIISGLWSTNPTFSLYVELWAIQSAINSWKRLSFTSTWRLIQWNRHEPRSATNRFQKHEVYWFWGWEI